MKKKILLLLLLFGCTTIYASFPVIESIDYSTNPLIVASDLTTFQKVLWFLGGVIFYGIPIAVIYQLITKKKGVIKFALFGFLSIILIIIIAFTVLSGEIDNPFWYS
jgi:hypothetical protein